MFWSIFTTCKWRKFFVALITHTSILYCMPDFYFWFSVEFSRVSYFPTAFSATYFTFFSISLTTVSFSSIPSICDWKIFLVLDSRFGLVISAIDWPTQMYDLAFALFLKKQLSFLRDKLLTFSLNEGIRDYKGRLIDLKSCFKQQLKSNEA